MRKQFINPLVTVIIVSFNSRKFLKNCLNAVFKQKISVEIIVADNHSADNSFEFLKQNYPNVNTFKNRKNLGYARAVNKAVKNAHGKYILAINADMTLGNNYLTKLISIMEKNPQIGAIQGKMYTGNHKILSTGLRFNYWGILISNSQFITDLKNKPVYVLSVEVPLVTKSVFNKIKGFDPHYWLYYEDLDFCWRIWLAGLRVVYMPAAGIYHHRGGSINQTNQLLMYQHAIYNCLYTYIKNYEIKNVIKALVTRLVITTISVLFYLSTGRFGLVKILIIPWIKIIYNLPQIWRKRRQIQSGRQISDLQIFQSAGIPFKFRYIFSQIKLILRSN